MKLKSLLFVCCFGLLASAYAENRHIHPQAEKTAAKTAAKNSGLPCEIEIINNSYDDVRVYGVFDDGSGLEPFSVYRRDAPHYIDLFYFGYCHSGMNLYINTFDGHTVYSGFTSTGTTLRIVPYYNQAKVEINKK